MFYYILAIGVTLFLFMIGIWYYNWYNKFIAFNGPIYIVDDDDNTHHINLLNNSKYLGFDCEWVCKKKYESEKKVSLIQISNGDICVLIRLHKFTNIPTNLKALLESTNNYKLGVGISMDVAKLFRDRMIEVNNWIDLRNINNNVMSNEELNNLNKNGLSGLTSYYIGRPLDKNLKIITSNWECSELSKEQMLYAATDAWCANIIFDKILINNKKLPNDIDIWIRSFVEHNYNLKKNKPVKVLIANNKKNLVKSDKPNIIKNKIVKGLRSKKLFDNVSMYSPDDVKISVISQDKANFYLKKKLAKRICDQNSIKLTFDPKGSGFFTDQEKRFYLDSDRGHCYICNETDDAKLFKFYIVHKNYRKYMPEKYKVHTIHDIGVLCSQCKYTAEHLYFKESNLMAKRYGFIETPVDKLKTKILKTAKLINSYEYDNKQINIPTKIIYDNKKILWAHFNKPENYVFSKQELCDIINNSTQKNDDNIYEFTMNKIDDIDKFIKTWRTFFVNKLKPQHLPTDWSIDFPCVTHSTYVLSK